MKYLPLLWAQLFRKKTRTILTILSVIVAFLLLGLLEAVQIAFESGADSADAKRLLTIARELLAGEIAARAARTDEAVEHLRAAVKAEDDLSYNEPSDWYHPTRHHLGAVLLAAGRAADAQAVFEEDLKRNPGNGWALAGLAASLKQQGKSADAAAVEKRLEKAWARADVPAVF